MGFVIGRVGALALGPVIDMGRFGVNGSWACVLRDGRLFDTPTFCKPRTEEFTPQAQVLLYPAAKTMLNPDALVVKPEPDDLSEAGQERQTCCPAI